MKKMSSYVTLFAVNKRREVKKPYGANTFLVQAMVDAPTGKKLDILAKAAARSRADYVRRLLIAHVNVVDPKVIKGIEKAWRGIEGSS